MKRWMITLTAAVAVTVSAATADAAVTPKTCTINVVNKGGVTKINNYVIANKVYGMSRDYNPGASSTMIRNYKAMAADAKKKGIILGIVGTQGAYGFRSYQAQQTLYNDYINMYGFNYASKISAKPGTSEHQAGVAMDIRDNSNYGTLSTAFEYTLASRYLKANAHRFGFIIRYLKGKESITGFMYEPWHIRYVGQKGATAMYKNHVTLEEYLGIAGKKKLNPGTYKVRGLICD
ncbi:M15 family metallopeptidase [Macrococcus equipercicus]|nr:M15 family metallopeptidase [Macrococcus equipercicus]